MNLETTQNIPFEVDSEILKHLAEVDKLLFEIDEMQATREKGQEEQLKLFIEDGYVRTLSEREGLLLITNKQMDKFKMNLRDWNSKVETVADEIEEVKKRSMDLATQLQKEKMMRMEIERRFRNKEEFEQKEKQNKKHIIQTSQCGEGEMEQEIDDFEEEVKRKVQIAVEARFNEKMKGMKDEIDFLKSQLLKKDEIITEMSNIHLNQVIPQHFIQPSNESQQVDYLKKRIETLQSQLAKQDNTISKDIDFMKNNIQEKLNFIERDIRKQQILLIEEKTEHQIECDTSRTLLVMDLQKQLYLTEEERDFLKKEFEKYKKESEEIIKENKAEKIEIERYKAELEKAIERTRQRVQENLLKQEGDWKNLKELEERIRELEEKEKLLTEEKENEKLNSIKSREDLEQKVLDLEKQLVLKTEIVMSYDPQIHLSYQQELTTVSMQLQQVQQEKQLIDKYQKDNQSLLKQQLESALENNKILLNMLNSSNNNYSNTNGQLCIFYKQKYQDIAIENDLLQASSEKFKSENSKLSQDISKLRLQLKQMQLIHKKSKQQKNTNPKIPKKNDTSSSNMQMEYQPLSQNIQNIITHNEDLLKNNQQLNIQIASFQKEIEALKEINALSPHSHSSAYSQDEIRPTEEQQEINSKLFFLQTLTQSKNLLLQ